MSSIACPLAVVVFIFVALSRWGVRVSSPWRLFGVTCTFPECPEDGPLPKLYDANDTLITEHRAFIEAWSKSMHRRHRKPSFDVIETDGHYALFQQDEPPYKMNATAWNASYAVDAKRFATQVPQSISTMTPRVLQGDHIALFMPFADVHAHILIDHLPLLALLREAYPVSTECKFILQNTNESKRMLEWLDPIFVAERVVWISAEETVRIENGRLLVWKGNWNEVRNELTVEALRRWIDDAKTNEPEAAFGQLALNVTREKYVLYLTRNSAAASHNRAVEYNHEQDIIQIIRDSMTKFNRTEKMLIFSGVDSGGQTLSLQTQFELFRDATCVVGPHGGAFGNIMWMGLPQSAYHPTPDVLEFIIGPHSHQVQPSSGDDEANPFRKSFFFLYRRASWVRYHHVLYAKNSTKDTTFIDLSSFRQALDAIWG